MAPDAERRDAQDPRGRADRAGLGAGARSATAAGGRRSSAGCGRAPSTTTSSRRLPTCVRAVRGRAWVTSVPSARLGGVCGDLGRAPRRRARRRAPRPVERTEARPPQREMANAVQQAANVRGAFASPVHRPPGLGVLLDDRRNSGWTLAMVGGHLRRAGASRAVPLVLGTLT